MVESGAFAWKPDHNFWFAPHTSVDKRQAHIWKEKKGSFIIIITIIIRLLSFYWKKSYSTAQADLELTMWPRAALDSAPEY